MKREISREDWEKVQEYDLSNILDDCTYMSHEEQLKAVEAWWKEYGNFILRACLAIKTVAWWLK